MLSLLISLYSNLIYFAYDKSLNSYSFYIDLDILIIQLFYHHISLYVLNLDPWVLYVAIMDIHAYGNLLNYRYLYTSYFIFLM